MAKRYIGIDIDGNCLRMAVVGEEKGALTLLATEKRHAEGDDLLAVLQALLGPERRSGDRLITALAASQGFSRWLTLPFADSKKIEATLAFELDAQLPIATADCQTDFLKPHAAAAQGYTVAAAAVRQQAIATFLAPFDDAGLPLQILDLAPFAWVGGLGRTIKEGVLIHAGSRETTVALIHEGRLASYRLLVGVRDEERLAAALVRDATALCQAAALPLPSVYLMGAQATPSLIDHLRGAQLPIAELKLPLTGPPPTVEFFPAVALALRGSGGDRDKGLNFRRGPFALKSEWAAQKRQIIGLSLLLLTALITLSTAAYLNYAHRAGRAEALKTQMSDIFREAFPKTPVIVDIPLQMQSGINEIKKKVGQFGATNGASPLAALREISQRTPSELAVDIKDFTYTPEGVRMEGVTSSFETTNRLAQSLKESPLFADAQLTDAKMSLDGSRVDFRIYLPLQRKDRP